MHVGSRKSWDLEAKMLVRSNNAPELEAKMHVGGENSAGLAKKKEERKKELERRK